MSDPAGAALTALTAAAAARVKTAIACIVNGGDCNEIKMGSMVSKRMRENGEKRKGRKERSENWEMCRIKQRKGTERTNREEEATSHRVSLA